MGETPMLRVVGVGGFVSAGPILAARKLGICVKMVNTDSVPGKANKLLSRYADEIYVQFEMSKKFFGSSAYRVAVTGCPLRAEFANLDRETARKRLFSGGLEPVSDSLEVVASSLKTVPSGLTTASSSLKRVLLITGASTGARSINETICVLLEKLSGFSDSWEIIHLTGKADFESVKSRYKDCKITHKVLDYYDGMADLLAAADLVIGRAGAVSVAEYAAAGVPCIVMPYPYHKDNHQRKNAEQLEKAGCAIIVDDQVDAQKNAGVLWPILQRLLATENTEGTENKQRNLTTDYTDLLNQKSKACPERSERIQNLKLDGMQEKARRFGKSNAAAEIAKKILNHRDHGEKI
jgi:UDP-N-acetylglucosamine--N-acetylmuramyl-(pentapeptide) pyrophosphoryl-undecaprenol N-acetylglucosamine transferase